MDFTVTTWIVLGLTLLLGWVLGLMSRSGGKRWKRELEREREEHHAAVRNRDAQLDAARARIAELERSRPAAAYRTDGDVHDARADLRDHDHGSAIENLDLRDRRDRVDGRYEEDVDTHGRTVIRPSRP